MIDRLLDRPIPRVGTIVVGPEFSPITAIGFGFALAVTAALWAAEISDAAVRQPPRSHGAIDQRTDDVDMLLDPAARRAAVTP